MENSNLSIKHIETEDGDQYYLLLENATTHLITYPLTCYLTDSKIAYKGELEEYHLEKYMKKLKMTKETFNIYNTEALFTQNVDYSYTVEKIDQNEVTLSWRRFQGKIKYKLGEVTMHLCDKDIISYYWKFSSNKLKENINEIEKLKSKIDEVTKDYESAMETIPDIIKEKEKLETDLYAKFVQVLNEKKRKIRELEKRIEDLESGSSNFNGTKNNIVASSSDSGSDTEMEKDEEEEEVEEEPMEIVVTKRSQRLGRRKHQEPVASSSKVSQPKAVPSTSSISQAIYNDDTETDSEGLLDDL